MRLLPEGLHRAPKTLLNVSVSHDRSFGTASISLSQVKALARTRNVTVNDIVLAVCSGALSRYLSARQDLPKEALIAAVPVSLREPGDNDLKVQAGMILTTLATDIADPLKRLAAISAAAGDAKARLSDIKQTMSGEMGDLLLGSPLLAPILISLAGYTHIYDLLRPVMNVVISNVPGPRQPYYCAGCRSVAFFPVSIPYHAAALNITNQSYLDNIDFGLVACRTTLPDVQEIADGIVAAFEELKQASDAGSDPSAIEILEIASPAKPALAAPPVIAIDPPEPILARGATVAAEVVVTPPAVVTSGGAVNLTTMAPQPAFVAAAAVMSQQSALAALEAAVPGTLPAAAAPPASGPAQHSALAELDSAGITPQPVDVQPRKSLVAGPEDAGAGVRRTPPNPMAVAVKARKSAVRLPTTKRLPVAAQPPKSKRPKNKTR